MFCLFVLAFAALATTVFGPATLAVVPLLLGYTTLLVADPLAASRGEVLLFFLLIR